MHNYLYYLTIVALNFIAQNLGAQNISGVVNKYAKVTDFDTCNVLVKVTDTTGFYKGLNVIVIQMNGAFISGSNDDKFGNLESLANAGLYEFNTVDSVAAGAIYLTKKFLNSYNLSAAVQIVSFPYYTDAIVTDTLQGKPWDGNTGGIIAIDALTLTLLNDVSATGIGLRGGAVASYTDCTGGSNYSDYYYSLNASALDNGGVKGEGIAQVIAGRECGRGNQLNGGGGGNNHKSGGGGGGNFGIGGTGGELIYYGNLFFPCKGKSPGVGGSALTSAGADRIFLGGGGGSGHNREKTASQGGNGGGIIVVRAVNFNGNSNKISANGANSPFSGGDGGGGGGAGGTILFYTTKYNSPVTLEIKGGIGGGTYTDGKYYFGPGGGGGGGRALTNNGSVPKNISGGLPGVNTSNKSSNNAQKGGDGVINTAAFSLPTSPRTLNRSLSIIRQPLATLVCTGKKTFLSIGATGNNLIYKWELNKNDLSGWKPLTNDSIYANTDSAVMLLANLKTDYNPYLYRCTITDGCNNNQKITSSAVSLNIKASPVAIFTTSINYNTVSFVNGSSNATNYKWIFGDGQTSTQINTTNIYASQGIFNVFLTASNSCDTVTYSNKIVLNTPPKANFSSNTVDYCTPASVQFFNNSSNNTTNYAWQFTGGTPSNSTDINPIITFNSPGIFNVTLISKNGSGSDTLIKTAYVRVNTKPSASFAFQKNGSTIGFQNQTAGGTSFVWDFGDGKSSVETNPQHAYTTSGNFIVMMVATNSCGSASFQDTVLLITLPTAVVSANTTNGCSPLIVQYAAQNASGTRTWDWSFPGGTPATSTLPNPRIIYNTIGTYDVSLTVSNAAGANTTLLQKYIQVYDAPSASFTMAIQNNTVVFRNNSTNANIYNWDFGDGTTSLLADPVSHTYAHNGTYTITLQTLNTYCGAATAKEVDIIFFVATNEADSTQLFSVYPNPNTGNFTIQNKSGISGVLNYKIINTSGQVLLVDTFNNATTHEVNANSLPEGLYALCLSDGTKTWLKKILIQR